MFLGIDVSKNTLDAALIGHNDTQSSKAKHQVFSNDASGHTALLSWLVEQGAETVHACLEATGTWAVACARVLVEAGHTVSLVNPARIHAFGRSQLKRTKTDKADSLLIASFCQMHNPPAWTPLSPQVQQLQGLIRRLESLEEMNKMEQNRLGSGGLCPAVQVSLEEHIAYLAQQIEKTRRQIKDHIDQDPDLKQQAKLLESIPGIGAATESVPQQRLCCWPNWATFRTSPMPVRSRLSPVWCLASANREPRYVAARVSRKSVLRVFASRFTFRPSPPFVSIRSSKLSVYGCPFRAKPRCSSLARRCENCFIWLTVS